MCIFFTYNCVEWRGACEIWGYIKKAPIMFHELASDPEKKVKEPIKPYKMKKMFLEEDDEEYGEGFGELEDYLNHIMTQ